VANFLPRSIIVTMVISFSISFAILFRQRQNQEHSASMPDATASVALVAAPAPPSPSSIAEAQTPSFAPPIQTAATAELPADTVPPDVDAAGELPVAFHIRNRRDLNKIDGDIRNITSKTLSITMRSVSSSSQATSEIHFQLAPGERKTYSTEDGLYMQTNDQLIVQSPPYQDRIVRVP
jgi:hypothetical protein